eukprot:TRINITY_DN20389_c0_g1_i1.p1 TRINITY_DN20389_c0_g1~~TRINITY_DN20389_c0_g1_i1.p1  ORF type:complete len:111 (-),score=24.31 TRINITY_DN20389_c0_g1_i1:60-359(-)
MATQEEVLAAVSRLTNDQDAVFNTFRDLKLLFNSIDNNKSGEIDVTELQRLIKLGLFTQAEIDEILAEDVNRDKKVSWGEFLVWTARIFGNEEKPRTKK